MTKGHFIRTKSAAILAIIFISTLLVKPVHILFPGHTDCTSSKALSDVDSSAHKDCGICHFSFSVYTPQEFTELTAPTNQPFIRISEKEFYTYTQLSASSNLLRAPPVL